MVMAVLGQGHKTNEWRLFIDSLKHGLKALFISSGKKHHSIPIA
jgi:hypothetical protein